MGRISSVTGRNGSQCVSKKMRQMAIESTERTVKLFERYIREV